MILFRQNRDCIFFFFSSRRRHTRLTCDWSSDVCSSDLAEALPALLAVGAPERMRLSGQAWAAAAAAGVGLIARGRLLPTVGADGTDVWRAGPLDPADLSWMRQLAAAFPPTAHPLAVPGSRPMRLRTPEALIRDLWDAIADLIARSP